MNKIILKLSILIIGVSILITSCKNEAYDLGYKLQSGDTFRRDIIADISTTQTMGNEQMEISNLLEMNTQYTVTDIDDGIYSIDMKIDKINIRMSMGGTAMMELNSNTTDSLATAENLSPIFKALVDVDYKMKTDRYGRIISFTGMEDMSQRMVNYIHPDLREQYESQVIASIEEQVSEEMITSAFEQLSDYFPQKPVSIGESWETNFESNSNNMSVSITMKNTLKSVEGTIATIESEGTVSTPEGGVVQNIENMEVVTHMSGTHNNIIKMDINTGIIISGESTQQMEGESNLMGISVPLSVFSKTIITN